MRLKCQHFVVRLTKKVNGIGSANMCGGQTTLTPFVYNGILSKTLGKEKFMPVLSKPRFVTWCHLPPISISVPHTPINAAEFPAAGAAFGDLSLVSSIRLFGARYGLLDISGLDHTEVSASLTSDERVRTHKVEGVRFLQCLEWIHKGNYTDKFTFNQIVAYLDGGGCIVAKPSDSGFDQVHYPDYAVPWTKGTLLLFIPDEP